MHSVDSWGQVVEHAPETRRIERMEQEGEGVAVEQVTVIARGGHHDCRELFVPGRTGEIQPFITNEPIDEPEHAQRWIEHYTYRWWIEAEYRSIKQ